MAVLLDFNKIAPLINCQTLILTPNSRTQKAIYSGQLKHLLENTVIQPANVKSFSQWQESIWSEFSFYISRPKRIASLAVQTWFEKQIKHETAWTLTNPSGVVTSILQAYQNMIQWNVDLSEIESNISVEVDYFKLWVNRFQQLSKDKNMIADFSLLSFIEKNINLIIHHLPKHILMVGFNHLTPLQKSFIQTLKQKGIKVEEYNFSIQAEKQQQLHFSNFTQELQYAARYAHHYQQDGKSVAVVVEQLASNLNEVHQEFSRTFQPEEGKPWVALTKPAYNVSAGFSLAEQPLIKSALLLLKLTKNKLTLEELHFLKNSPFIHWGKDKNEIKFFLHQLCLNARKYYSKTFLYKQISESSNGSKLSELFSRLKSLDEVSSQNSTIESYTGRWLKILSIWQWGNQHELNEFELQAKHSFLGLVKQCCSLSEIYEKITSQDAFDYLTQLSNKQSFQIASDRTNVHVLGVLEATGLQFDHLIIVGFNQNNWPQKNKINAFLPLELQREKDMPGSSSEREYLYTKDLSATLLQSAKNIIVTSSSNIEQECLPSSFYSHLPTAVDEFSELDVPLTTETDYCWVDDSIINIKDYTIKGGSSLLSNYAQCPFKSISYSQLKVKGYDLPELGIDPKSKGTWLHECMEVIWGLLKTQEGLINTPKDKLESLVSMALSKTLEKHHSYLLAVAGEEIVNLENHRLTQLILEWLQIEKERESFSIKSLESETQLTLNGLSLNLRIDRIDNNQQGQIKIIDYKSGLASPKNWFSVRPVEAQMPAYLLALNNESFYGLAYGIFKTGEVALSGLNSSNDSTVIADQHNIQGKRNLRINELDSVSFEQLRVDWKKSLSRISKGILSGYMPVSPKKIDTCLYCDYKPFCRIDEEQPNV